MAGRSQPQLRSKFFHLAQRRGRKIAKGAMARRLAVHLYWMWRQGWDYAQFEKFGSQRGHSITLRLRRWPQFVPSDERNVKE